MIKKVDKIWGKEIWLVNNNKYCAKYLYLNNGYECSVHFHSKKDETFYILEGEVELFVTDISPYFDNCFFYPEQFEGYLQKYKKEIINSLAKIVLTKGNQYRLYSGIAHKFRSITPTSKILEISTTHYDYDSYRITKSRKLNNDE